MKNIYALLIAGLFVSNAWSQAYKVPFKLTDSTFITGSVFTARLEIELDNRNFRESSKPLLDSLADFLIRHPELVIEIGSYTDQRGNDSNNLVLSQNRANKVKEYLVSKGVDKFSLPAVGYGEANPVAPQTLIDRTKGNQEQEDLYQKNRRYEFTILTLYRDGCFSYADTNSRPGSILRLPILYDLGKSTVRPESYPLIDSLAKFLIAHPEIKIEVGNHTDTRGSTASNIKLTDARSRSVVDCLVLRGVPASQVFAKGYGENQTLVTEAYVNSRKSREGRDQLHQLNRRTEIKIISTGQ